MFLIEQQNTSYKRPCKSVKNSSVRDGKRCDAFPHERFEAEPGRGSSRAARWHRELCCPSTPPGGTSASRILRSGIAGTAISRTFLAEKVSSPRHPPSLPKRQSGILLFISPLFISLSVPFSRRCYKIIGFLIPNCCLAF